MILALDIAKITGWAHESGEHGVIDLSHADDWGRVGYLFRLELRELLNRFPVTLMAIEAPFNRGPSSLLLSGMQIIAHSLAYEAQIPRREVNISTIKKQTTGNGRASKADMIEAVRAKGWEPRDDNAADAIALLEIVKAAR